MSTSVQPITPSQQDSLTGPVPNSQQDLAPAVPAAQRQQQDQEGGRRKKRSTKGRKSQRGGQTQGGSLVASVSSLAVPFGLMFAKQSLKAFLEKARQQKKSARPSSPKKLKRRPLRRYVGGEVLDGHEAAAMPVQQGGYAEALLAAPPARVTDAEAFSQTFPQMPHHGASAQAGGKKKKSASKRKPRTHRGGERQDEQQQSQQQEGGKKKSSRRRSSSKKPAKRRSASKH